MLLIIKSTFFILGGKDDYVNNYDSILQFDMVDHKWDLVGQMQYERQKHAVSVVRSEDINYCQDYPTTTTTPGPTTTTGSTTTSNSTSYDEYC